MLAAITTSLLAGLVFGIGLLVSGMANPAKVLGFLDIAGQWDPSLAFVMGGAVAMLLGGSWADILVAFLATGASELVRSELVLKGVANFFAQAAAASVPSSSTASTTCCTTSVIFRGACVVRPVKSALPSKATPIPSAMSGSLSRDVVRRVKRGMTTWTVRGSRSPASAEVRPAPVTSRRARSSRPGSGNTTAKASSSPT